MGCCHLFVVEQISEVDAHRTPVPPDEQSFECSDQSWQAEYPQPLNPTIADRLAANKQFLAEQMRAHGDEALTETMTQSPWDYDGLTGSLIFTSPDLLTTYRGKFPQSSRSSKKNKAEMFPSTITMNVTKEHCLPQSN